jgi:DNA mismatch repair protein MSH5
MFTLGNSMFVNADTLISLQILGSEQHPNAQQAPDKAKTGAKEDLSVYGLVKSLAVTSQGKAHLRKLFLRPSNDMDLIIQRHRSIAAFLRPDNAAVMIDIKKSLRRIKDVRTTIANLTKGVHQTNRMQGVKNGVWLTLLRFAHASIELAGLIHNLAGGKTLEILAKVRTPYVSIE